MLVCMTFSEYPKDHQLYDSKNKKVIGNFKDETNGTYPAVLWIEI